MQYNPVFNQNWNCWPCLIYDRRNQQNSFIHLHETQAAEPINTNIKDRQIDRETERHYEYKANNSKHVYTNASLEHLKVHCWHSSV